MAQVVFAEQAIADIEDIAAYIGYDSIRYAQLLVGSASAKYYLTPPAGH